MELRFKPRPCLPKVVFVMGATGTGKSRLAIDIATRCLGEVINSDKVQVYKGLDITTNKVTEEECRGVPHHLLGILPDPESDFSTDDFVRMALDAVDSIVRRGNLPIIVGGTNSFIEALMGENEYCNLRYDVCFLWVDVDMQVLKQSLYDRVNSMVKAGIVEEIRSIYNPNADYSKGILRSIGPRQLDTYFRAEYSPSVDQETRDELLERAIKRAIKKIKIATYKLAVWQIKSIHRLKNVKGWKLHRLDATKVLGSDQAWEKLVAEPASNVVKEFLLAFTASAA